MSNLASASDMKRHGGFHSKPRGKNTKSTLVGKSVHQVQRRNERERRRVQQINNGYTVLARSVAGWKECKSRNKLSKVETLREAVKYIKHLEEVLNVSSNTNTRDTKSFDYSAYLPQKIEAHNSIADSMAFNFPAACYSQCYDQRLSASTTCSSDYDSAYASPTYGQSFSHPQTFMNVPQQFYGMSHHENLPPSSR